MTGVRTRSDYSKDDKDLVHEFVNNQGLQCLIKIGRAADQNYQNYILRGTGTFPFASSTIRGVMFYLL